MNQPTNKTATYKIEALSAGPHAYWAAVSTDAHGVESQRGDYAAAREWLDAMRLAKQAAGYEMLPAGPSVASFTTAG